MPRVSARMRALAVAAVLVIALAAGLVYYLRPGCQAKLEFCCLTTNMGFFRVNGNCPGLKVRIVDSTGIVRAEISVKEGLNEVNLSLPSEGEYLVELVAHGKVIDRVPTRTEAIPRIVSVRAIVQMNGRMTLDVKAEGVNSCVLRAFGKDRLYITQIAVLVEFSNGTTKNLTFNGEWSPGTITLDLGLTPQELMSISSVHAYVRDNMDRTYTVQVFFPR